MKKKELLIGSSLLLCSITLFALTIFCWLSYFNILKIPIAIMLSLGVAFIGDSFNLISCLREPENEASVGKQNSERKNDE